MLEETREQAMGGDVSEDERHAISDRRWFAGTAVLDAPAATVTDIERKVIVVADWDGAHEIGREIIDRLLADVRSLTAVA